MVIFQVGCLLSLFCFLVLFRFPANEKKQKLWTAAVRRWKWHPKKYSYICSDHFLVTDYPLGTPWSAKATFGPLCCTIHFPKVPKTPHERATKTRRKLVRKNPCLKTGAKGQRKSQTVKKPKEGKSDPNSSTKMRLRKKSKCFNKSCVDEIRK